MSKNEKLPFTQNRTGRFWTKFLKEVISNGKRNTDGKILHWLKICWMRFKRDEIYKIFYIISAGNSQFKILDLENEEHDARYEDWNIIKLLLLVILMKIVYFLSLFYYKFFYHYIIHWKYFSITSILHLLTNLYFIIFLCQKNTFQLKNKSKISKIVRVFSKFFIVSDISSFTAKKNLFFNNFIYYYYYCCCK